MFFPRGSSEFEHISENCGFAPASELSERGDAGAHGIRVGIVGVVDDEGGAAAEYIHTVGAGGSAG